MPTGKTISGIDASGAIVVVYYMDRLGPIFLMGQETKFLTEVHKKLAFTSSQGEDIIKSFLYNGDVSNAEKLTEAKQKFTNTCIELEKAHPRLLRRVTFADIKNSAKSPGNISAKPRCVADTNYDKYGFPKGGYELEDASINDNAIRECEQETGIKLDITRLKEYDLPKRQGYYALFLYELSSVEYEAINTEHILEIQNAKYDNELHNIRFMRIPQTHLKNFFINALSRDAYEHAIKHISAGKKGGNRKSKKHTRKVGSHHISKVHVSSLRNGDRWFEHVFVNRKSPRKV